MGKEEQECGSGRALWGPQPVKTVPASLVLWNGYGVAVGLTTDKLPACADKIPFSLQGGFLGNVVVPLPFLLLGSFY